MLRLRDPHGLPANRDLQRQPALHAFGQALRILGLRAKRRGRIP